MCVSVRIVRSGTCSNFSFYPNSSNNDFFYANTSKFHVSLPYVGSVEGAVNRSRNFLDFLIAKVRV